MQYGDTNFNYSKNRALFQQVNLDYFKSKGCNHTP